jgi:hypothetical protein
MAAAMVDHGHPLEFGISIVPYADALDCTRELARAADDGGQVESFAADVIPQLGSD